MPKTETRSRLVLTLLAVGVALGCSSSEHQLAPVGGVVTLDGQPVANAAIDFQPIGSVEHPNPGPSSIARTDAAGRYELATIKGDPGAVVTKHRVVIRTPRPAQTSANDSGVGQPVFKDPIPARYNDNSELTYEVPAEGTSSADFKLTTTP